MEVFVVICTAVTLFALVNSTALSQPESSNFFMYITGIKTFIVFRGTKKHYNIFITAFTILPLGTKLKTLK